MLTVNAHIIDLPKFSKAIFPHEPNVPNPNVIAAQWVSKLESVLTSKDASRLASIFHSDCWWRDMLALQWDFRTVHGLEKVTEYIGKYQETAQISTIRLRQNGQFAPNVAKPTKHLKWIESMFDFETKTGRGSGMLRIVQGADGIWKGYMMYTVLKELKGAEENAGYRRPHGGTNSLLGGAVKGNWQERRQRQLEFLDEEPQVLIVGAGQAGLNTAARLQAIGMSCLIVDKNSRIGDNWRHRYRTLVTHDPVQTTHMAFLPFPSTWPLFTAKDKIGDWFEAYASLLELNVWTNTRIDSTEYNDETGEWLVQVERGGKPNRRLKPRHVIMCTGHSGEPRVPNFPGQKNFEGAVYHSSEHQDASLSGDITGKKVLVVGTGNSGHDIAQNFQENGADVTMIQRRGTYVFSAKTGLFMLYKGLYDEGGPPTEDADVYGQSLPLPVRFALNVDKTSQIAAAEKDSLDGLEKAGFKVDFGEDGSGIVRKYLTRGGGYYIDVGCSQLVIDGKIKVQQSPDGIKGFEPRALVLADGTKLEADIVVLATGYDNMVTSARKIFGDKVADRCNDVWDLDDEGEIKTMWRSSGHPHFWFMGGNFSLCRIYSRLVALQIKAIEEGYSKQP